MYRLNKQNIHSELLKLDSDFDMIIQQNGFPKFQFDSVIVVSLGLDFVGEEFSFSLQF